jgi:capsular exopolysaccharide synthesis family protein
MLRTRLQHHRKQPRMVLVSSAEAGDGKSVTAINLAGALSLKIEENVLLVDGDCRRSNIHAQLGLPLSPGLSEVLSGSSDLAEAIIRLEQLPNLSVLTAGEPRVNPSELLDSTAWRDLAASLRERFRYVIVDSPPVGSVADYELLQAVCDGVILVARPDHSSRAVLLSSLKTVPEDKQLGLVMNCVSPWFLNGKRAYAGYY